MTSTITSLAEAAADQAIGLAAQQAASARILPAECAARLRNAIQELRQARAALDRAILLARR
jgi:hypothetical protein